MRAKEKRESDEKIASQNMAFQLEIQKLKAQLKNEPVQRILYLIFFNIECL